MPRYWKTTVTVTVISTGDDPVCFDDIDGLSYLINHTDFCTGEVDRGVSEEIDHDTARRLLEEQGMDSCFLDIGAEGGDEDDGQEDE